MSSKPDLLMPITKDYETLQILDGSYVKHSDYSQPFIGSSSFLPVYFSSASP